MLNNLFSDLPAPGAAEEHFVTLMQQPGLRIERIVSHGQASPPGFWYDQPEAEWVLLLQGRAELEFAEPFRRQPLQAGDFLEIPAHCRHRVAWTDPDAPCLWLAIHHAPAG
jgi:cupin 2 domain-containing protein